MGKSYEFHDLAMGYRRMSDRDLGRMEEGMREHGYDERFPIVLFEGKILDGCNRYIAAERAGVTPVYVRFTGSYEEARAFVQLANEERRHLTEQELSEKRESRLVRVKAARQEGKSTRAIAEQEGVSREQVRRDIKASGDTPPCHLKEGVLENPGEPGGAHLKTEGANGTNGHAKEPATVTGRDGKTYAATKPADKPKGNKVDPWDTPENRRKEKFKEAHQHMGKLVRVLDELDHIDGGMVRHAFSVRQTLQIALKEINAWEGGRV